MIISQWPRSWRYSLLFLSLSALFVFCQDAFAQDWNGQENVRVTLLADSSTIVPGQPLRIGLYLQMKPGWHIYWKNPGEIGFPPTVEWKVPQGVEVSAFQWPIPLQFTLGNIVDYGYEGDVLLIAEVSVSPKLNAKELVIKGHAKWLVCAQVCLPGEEDLALTLPVANSASPTNTALFERFQQQLPVAAPPFPVTVSKFEGGTEICARPGMGIKRFSFYPLPRARQKIGKIAEIHNPDAEEWMIRVPVVGSLDGILVTETEQGIRKGYQLKLGEAPSSSLDLVQKIKPGLGTTASPLTLFRAILYGFIGGFILNLMPCVFPVISLKVFSFIRQAHEKPRLTFYHGLAFTTGVFVWFLVLAAVVVILQQKGHTANWAFQFQNPAFNFVIIAIVFVFALNMLGVFEVSLPASTTTKLSSFAGYRGLLGSFFQGGLATLLATPCTAPFLGAALGFAFAESGVVVFLIFMSVALGLAWPYLLLSVQTGWVRFIPRPGPWMEHIKRFMAFPLFATAVWLLMVLGSQRGLSAVIAALAVLLCLGFSCWLIGSFAQTSPSQFRRKLYLFASLAIAFLAVFFAWPHIIYKGQPQPFGISWKPYSEAALHEALAAGSPVFVDFTADWCLSCKFNEKTAIERPRVAAAFRSRGVVAFKADWTNKDPTITAALRAFGRAGVPFYVFYPARKPNSPVILPEFLTESIILQTIKNPPEQ